MATLSFTKYSNKVWKILASDIPNLGTNGFSFSKPQILTDGLELWIASDSGSVTNRYQLSDITVYASEGGTPETGWSTMQALLLRLEELNFPAWNAVSGSGGATAFIQLTDTPSSYVGQGSKTVRVKADESGLEFVTGGGGGSQDLQETLENGGVATTTEAGVTSYVNLGQDVGNGKEFRHNVFDESGNNGVSVVNASSAILQNSAFNEGTEVGKLGAFDVVNGEPTIKKENQYGTDTGIQSFKLPELSEAESASNTEIVFVPKKKTVSGTYELATMEDLPSGGSEWIVVSANKTAVNDEQYSNVANATYTDPTPVEGKGYNVKVVNGTATIGGVGYAEGRTVTRTYHSGSWRSKVYVDETIVGSATVTAFNGKQNKEDFIKIASAHSLTNTTALQSITNVAHNVEAGTYRFYCRFSLSSLAASGTISFGSLGTATITAGNWISNGNKQNAFPNTNFIAYGSLPSAVQITSASAGTNGVVTIEGEVTFSSSGTFIPAIALSSAPTSGQTDAGAYTSLIKLS